jgi:hypothetical protein
MLRLNRFSMAWIALGGLIAPALARAEVPAAWPVLPVSTAASTAEPTSSSRSAASQISYEQDTPEEDLPPSVTDAPAPSADTKTSSCCNSCMGSCCGCLSECRSRNWFVGVEAALLAPVLNHGGGGASYAMTNTNGVTTNTYNSNSVNGMIVTPRIWAGVMGQCWGVGVRYWRFDNSNGGGTITPATLGGNLGLFNQNALRLQTFDLEVIRRISYCDGGQVWLSAGARYGQFTRNGIVSGADLTGGSTFTGTAWAGTGFNGVGPTFAIYGWRPISCSNWNLFYGARGSYLWDGSSSAAAGTTASVGNNFGGAASANAAFTSIGTANAFVGELNLGMQYNHCLKCVPAIAFLRIAGEYQYWHINNNAVATSTSGATDGFGLALTRANTGNSTLGLLGFGISTGFMY